METKEREGFLGKEMKEELMEDIKRAEKPIKTGREGYESAVRRAAEEDRERAAQRAGRMERVYICSQYATRGDMMENLHLAEAICRKVIGEGKIPICPHLAYSRVLDDRIAEERAAGIRIGLELLRDCDEVRVWTRLAEGMKGEIREASRLGIPIACQGGDRDILAEVMEVLHG